MFICIVVPVIVPMANNCLSYFMPWFGCWHNDECVASPQLEGVEHSWGRWWGTTCLCVQAGSEKTTSSQTPGRAEQHRSSGRRCEPHRPPLNRLVTERTTCWTFLRNNVSDMHFDKCEYFILLMWAECRRVLSICIECSFKVWMVWQFDYFFKLLLLWTTHF